MFEKHLSTLITFYPDGSNQVYSFGTKKEYPEVVKKENWIEVKKWRGYTNWELAEGFIEIGDGWLTGLPDRTTGRKIELNDLILDLKNKKITPPCEIYWLFGTTSNVFSIASKIITKEENIGLVEKWLNEINGGISGLKEILS